MEDKEQLLYITCQHINIKGINNIKPNFVGIVGTFTKLENTPATHSPLSQEFGDSEWAQRVTLREKYLAMARPVAGVIVTGG